MKRYETINNFAKTRDKNRYWFHRFFFIFFLFSISKIACIQMRVYCVFNIQEMRLYVKINVAFQISATRFLIEFQLDMVLTKIYVAASRLFFPRRKLVSWHLHYESVTSYFIPRRVLTANYASLWPRLNVQCAFSLNARDNVSRENMDSYLAIFHSWELMLLILRHVSQM